MLQPACLIFTFYLNMKKIQYICTGLPTYTTFTSFTRKIERTLSLPLSLEFVAIGRDKLERPIKGPG